MELVPEVRNVADPWEGLPVELQVDRPPQPGVFADHVDGLGLGLHGIEIAGKIKVVQETKVGSGWI